MLTISILQAAQVLSSPTMVWTFYRVVSTRAIWGPISSEQFRDLVGSMECEFRSVEEQFQNHLH
jgi:hypothetical protein